MNARESSRLSVREREALALDRACGSAALEGLARDTNQRVRMAVALNPSTPPDVLLALVDDPSEMVSGTAVHNLSADRAVWDRALAKGGDSLLDLASVPWLPHDIAEQLARHQDRHVRRALASSTVWRPVLAQLAADSQPEVRSGVAASASADLELWRQLSTDRRKEVRAQVASNPHVPAELLAGFAGDRSVDVRWAVVTLNPHLPDLVRLFADDADETIRDHARRRVDNPATCTFQADGTIRFRYPGSEDPEPVEVDPTRDPVGAEMIRQSVEVEAKRRSFALRAATH